MTDPNLILDETGTILKGVKDSSITSVDIPDSVTTIRKCAFMDCTSLKTVSIPDSVTEIGDYAFGSCTALQAIYVAEKNEHYASSDGILFNKNQSALLQFPAGKKTESYSIPDSVTEIGDAAFMGCTSLQAIDIPDSVTEIGWGAFKGCTSLKAIYCQIKSLKDVFIYDYAFGSTLYDSATLIVPSGTRWKYRHHPVFGKFKNIEINHHKSSKDND